VAHDQWAVARVSYTELATLFSSEAEAFRSPARRAELWVRAARFTEPPPKKTLFLTNADFDEDTFAVFGELCRKKENTGQIVSDGVRRISDGVALAPFVYDARQDEQYLFLRRAPDIWTDFPSTCSQIAAVLNMHRDQVAGAQEYRVEIEPVSTATQEDLAAFVQRVSYIRRIRIEVVGKNIGGAQIPVLAEAMRTAFKGTSKAVAEFTGAIPLDSDHQEELAALSRSGKGRFILYGAKMRQVMDSAGRKLQQVVRLDPGLETRVARAVALREGVARPSEHTQLPLQDQGTTSSVEHPPHKRDDT
jgi:hypothetical protein